MIREHEAPQGSDTITVTKDWEQELDWAHTQISFCEKALTVLDSTDRLYRKYTFLREAYLDYQSDCIKKVRSFYE